MAGTINTNAFIQLSEATGGIVTLALAIPSTNFTQTGTQHVAGTQSIGTTAEAFAVGDVGTMGWAFFKNLDASDDVQIGVDNSGFVPFAELEPGEWCIAPLSSAPYGKSLGAGAIRVQYVIIEQ